jgi:predicted nucleic acid-binding protein
VPDAVAVDTNIWQYAFCEPQIVGGPELREEARRFLDALLADHSRTIAVSEYQVCETLEVMRKLGVPLDTRRSVRDLLRSVRCRVVRCGIEVVDEAFALSAESGIHIYDYMVALPLRYLVNVIYTADEHFGHAHFQAIARIENPLSWVMVEGRVPRRKT